MFSGFSELSGFFSQLISEEDGCEEEGEKEGGNGEEEKKICGEEKATFCNHNSLFMQNSFSCGDLNKE